MTRIVTKQTVTQEELDELLLPRTAPAVETPGTVPEGDHHRFELERGPFDRYVRRVKVEPSDDKPGRFAVTTVTEYDLAIPVWGFAFEGLVARAVKHPPRPGERLWWMPPDIPDARASRSLSLLCALGAFAAYLGTLLSQLNSYFRPDFGATTSEVSDVLIAVRVGAVLAFGVMTFADRLGRRRVLVGSLVAACCIAALGSIAPNLFLLGVTQSASRAFSATVALLTVIMAAEEMPSGARAFAVSMLTMSAAVGSGGVVMFLGFADRSPGAWRVFFAIPLLFIIPALRLARHLPETRRYELHEEVTLARTGTPAPVVPAAVAGAGEERRSHLRRFVVLGVGALLLNLFIAPASNFMNDYLKSERAYSGGQITLMQVLTNFPGGLSIIVGGYLADRFGRRIIGAIGLAAGAGFTVLMYLSSGIGIYVYSFFGTFIGAIAVPALGVYGPELFPTGARGRFGGALNLLAVTGSVIGLKTAGILAGPGWFGTADQPAFGPPIAILGLGPLLLVVIVLAFYPETAHKELEELNPEDLAPPASVEGLRELDEEYDEHHPDHPGHGGVDLEGDHGPPEAGG